MIYKSIKENTLLNVVRMSLTVLFPLISFPYVSRVLAPDGIGAINFVQSIATIFTLFASLGIYTYGVREGSKIREDRSTFSIFAKQLILINIIATVITYVVYFASLFIIPRFTEQKTFFLIYGCTIGFSSLGLDWIYGVYEEYRYITIRQAVCQILCLASMFIFVKSKQDIYYWAVINVCSNIGSNIFNLINSKKYIDYRFATFNTNNIGKHVKPVLTLFATKVSMVVYNNIDTAILGLLTTTYSVGLYTASVKINNILITCISAMTPVFVPRIIFYISNHEEHSLKVLESKIFSLVLFFTVPAVFGLELLSENIIRIVAGVDYIDAVSTLRIISPIVIINSLSGIIYYDILVPNKREDKVLLCTIFAAFTNIILSVLMVKRFEQNGVAFGSLIAELMALIMAIFVARNSLIHFYKKVLSSFVRYMVASIAMALIVLPIKILASNCLIGLVLAIIIGGCVYFLSLWVLKDYMFIEVLSFISKFFSHS